MKFIFLSLAIMTLISKVWGIVEQVTHNKNIYYVFTGDSLMENALQLSVVKTEDNKPLKKGNIIQVPCKNNTNQTLKIWTGNLGLVELQQSEEKTISWDKVEPLMVLAQGVSVPLDKRIYKQVLEIYRK
ncbi:hypothetical protein PGT21_019975 [Puccinia graminis f. sp. tritici]|uniref:LysM domain-containing protein n=1 Tax=Puccinia graminis f. sp. tritici TaxID=56615 RepID=A0A5B0SM33_PUCGR|nr:hypothetical protein PGT21_019975 [Puccinia graminis f. sp. tritici]KAA1138439.1 hypothetical protein PGTUg99_010542 [Puccinia graminis f. sp. tritici]